MIRFILCIGLLPLLFSSCQEPSGACDYRYFDFEATVTNITPYKEGTNNLLHVEMSFNKSDLYNSPQYFEQLKNIKIDSSYIKRNNIHLGNIYSGTVSEITKGNCTPLFVSFNQKFID